MTSSVSDLEWVYAQLCTADELSITDDQYALAETIAIDWLWAMSGRQFGTRDVALRPQSRSINYPGFGSYSGLESFDSPLFGGLIYNTDDYGPERYQYIELNGPVVGVTAVVIEGTEVDSSLYRVEGNFLVRQDGGVWPVTQNLIAQLDAANTWAVYYTRGITVPPWGQYATGKLICYLGKQLATGQPCAVPWNTTSVTRGGVSIQRDITKAAKVTGVAEVDQWMSIVNPNSLLSGPTIWSPDIDRRRAPFAGSYQGSNSPIGVPVEARESGFLVLGPTDPVPAGTPVGTVILRNNTP